MDWNRVDLEGSLYCIGTTEMLQCFKCQKSSFTKVPLFLLYSLFHAAWKSHPADADPGTFDPSLSWRIDPLCRSVDLEHESLAGSWGPTGDSAGCQ